MEAITLQVQVIFQLSKFLTHFKSSQNRRVYIEWWEFQGQLMKTEGANWFQGAERTLLLHNSWYYSSKSIWGSCERPSVVQDASYNSHIQPHKNTGIQCFWKHKPACYSDSNPSAIGKWEKAMRYHLLLYTVLNPTHHVLPHLNLNFSLFSLAKLAVAVCACLVPGTECLCLMSSELVILGHVVLPNAL